jgi:quercetin dioxygenase-like cupin family protein
MNNTAMIHKSNTATYTEVLPGIELSNLTFGNKTHLIKVRLAKGAILPEHNHLNEQTGYLLSGKLRFFSGDTEIVAEPGDCWTFPGNMPHGAEALENSVVVECFSPVREDYLNL